MIGAAVNTSAQPAPSSTPDASTLQPGPPSQMIAIAAAYSPEPMAAAQPAPMRSVSRPPNSSAPAAPIAPAQ